MPVASSNYCCSWNLKNCDDAAWCNESSDNCKECTGFWIDDSLSTSSCTHRYEGCDNNSLCCPGMECLQMDGYTGCGVSSKCLAYVYCGGLFEVFLLKPYSSFFLILHYQKTLTETQSPMIPRHQLHPLWMSLLPRLLLFRPCHLPHHPRRHLFGHLYQIPRQRVP